jgi:hypothetical protein
MRSEEIQDPPTAEDTMTEWHNRWDRSENGRRTYCLIPDIGCLINRNHGQVSFHITLPFSGNGCFVAYLKRFDKLDSSECWYCGHPNNDALHTLFVCDAWENRHSRVNPLYGTSIPPANLVSFMLQSAEFWAMGSRFINEVLRKKENEERRRQSPI